jgi:nucleotide-binding universal stress UspA family protein
VYYDASPESQAALTHACVLGRAFNADLHVLVVSDINSVIACAESVFSNISSTANLDDAAEAFVGSAIRQAREEGRTIEGHIEMGEPSCCIIEKAASLNACAVVIGRRKRSWLQRAWLRDQMVWRLLNAEDRRIVITVGPREVKAFTGRPPAKPTGWFAAPAFA